MRPFIFITGTDTGVGKTVLTCLLTDFFRRRGLRVAAFKPLCSGGRADARALHAALGGTLSLDEVNPWYFRAPLTPALAARRERKTVRLAAVLAHLRARQSDFDLTLVEGAGGLLSPLGVDFDSRDLITSLRAVPVIVATNRLGAVNHVLLTREALPPRLRKPLRVLLMAPARPDAATVTNARVMAAWIPPRNLFQLPWLGRNPAGLAAQNNPRVVRTLSALAASLTES